MEETMNHNQAMFEALKGGPASIAEIAKHSKLAKEDVEATMENWHTGRLWVTPIETSRTTRYQLTDAGRSNLSARGTEGTTDGSTRFSEYNRSHV